MRPFAHLTLVPLRRLFDMVMSDERARRRAARWGAATLSPTYTVLPYAIRRHRKGAPAPRGGRGRRARPLRRKAIRREGQREHDGDRQRVRDAAGARRA